MSRGRVADRFHRYGRQSYSPRAAASTETERAMILPLYNVGVFLNPRLPRWVHRIPDTLEVVDQRLDAACRQGVNQESKTLISLNFLF